MSPARLDAEPERGTIVDAMRITGLRRRRTVQALAAAGKLPGAAKIAGSWTFDLRKLRAYVADREMACQDAASATPRKIAIGATASCMAALRSVGSSDDSAYAQAMSMLRRPGSRPRASAR
jgi:hypothetical protein